MRDMWDIEDKIKKIMAKQFGIKPEDIRSDMNILEDIMVESIDIVDFVAKLEREFGIEISMDVVYRRKTVKELIEYMRKRLSSSQA